MKNTSETQEAEQAARNKVAADRLNSAMAQLAEDGHRAPEIAWTAISLGAKALILSGFPREEVLEQMNVILSLAVTELDLLGKVGLLKKELDS